MTQPPVDPTRPNRQPPTEATTEARLKHMDPAILGQRLKHARLRAGLNQTEAAEQIVAPSYISRMEAGTRRPDTHILIALAERLGTTAEDLVSTNPADPVPAEVAVTRLTSELDYAEMALNTGSSGEAKIKTQVICAELDALVASNAAVPANLLHNAHHAYAKALEAEDEPDQAIAVLETLIFKIDPDTNLGLLLQVYIALTRINRDAGRYDEAIRIGEEGQTVVSEATIYAVDEGLRLVATIASAYYENNQPDKAIRICLDALSSAEDLGTPYALGAIYWNTSGMYHREGNAEAALPLAVRALELLDQARDAKQQARLRGQLGTIQLDVFPPLVDEAIANIEIGIADLYFTDAKPGDIAANLLYMARARYMNGEYETALDLIDQAERLVGDSTPARIISANSLRGRVATERGEMEAAQDYFRQAVMGFSALGADKNAARLWYELAEYLYAVGMVEEALQAYQSAGIAAGLKMTPKKSSDWAIPDGLDA